MRAATGLVLLLLATSTALAEDDASPGNDDAKGTTIASARPTYGGLSGFGELVTTEVAGEGELGFRGGISFQHQHVKIDNQVGGGTIRSELRAQVYTLQGAVGLLDIVEFSLSVPILDYELSTDIMGGRDQDAGFGNPEVAVKLRAPINLDLISLAAYSRVHLPWGENDIVQPRRLFREGKFAEWELGAAVGVHAGLIHGYMNLAFRLLETGIQSFRYRFGVALRPIDLLEVGVYYDGEEFEGSVRSNGWFGANATVFFAPLYVGVGAEGLILDNAYDDLATGGAGDEIGAYRLTFFVGAAF